MDRSVHPWCYCILSAGIKLGNASYREVNRVVEEWRSSAAVVVVWVASQWWVEAPHRCETALFFHTHWTPKQGRIDHVWPPSSHCSAKVARLEHLNDERPLVRSIDVFRKRVLDPEISRWRIASTSPSSCLMPFSLSYAIRIWCCFVNFSKRWMTVHKWSPIVIATNAGSIVSKSWLRTVIKKEYSGIATSEWKWYDQNPVFRHIRSPVLPK